MTTNENPRAVSEAVKIIAAITALMGGVFTLLEIFLPTSLIQPFGALTIGLGSTVILIWAKKWRQEPAFVTWLGMSVVLIVIYFLVSRPAIIVGAVIDQNNQPVNGLVLILRDSSGVPHEVATDLNGEFETGNVPEGKYTILADGRLLISGEVPSGWQRIFDPQITLPAVVHEPTSTIVAMATPTNTPTAAPTTTPSLTTTPTPIPTDTPTVTPTPTFTPTPTRTRIPLPTPTPRCDQVSSFRITSPEGPGDPVTSPDNLPRVSRATTISWRPAYCPMTIHFYQNQTRIDPIFESAQSGTIDAMHLQPGWTQIKIWVPGTTIVADNVHVVFLP